MSKGTAVTNPGGAFVTVSDFRTGRDDSGAALMVGQMETYTVRANANIALGEACSWVAPTATVPVSATPMAAATDVSLFAGIAQHAAVTGEQVLLVRRGFTRVLGETADTAAAGNVLRAPDTTTGRAAVAGALGAAGKCIGVVLGPEDGTTDFCFAFLDPVIMPQTA